ncbi:uncharacterized protein PAE49_015095 isoform 1-T3 [Odontesthes bonariensis]|uniref:uncharacterized protein LOC142386863 n=1 Tax=Odontesthes bonariensis TaxID=219752 RepID=UPI003F589790
MEPINVVWWIDMFVCFPLTIALICWLCYEARRPPVPVYYMNLLISNLIWFCSFIVLVAKDHTSSTSGTHALGCFCTSLASSLGFRMCIAVERFSVVACPQLHCIRQMKGSLLLCAAVWAVCIVVVPLLVTFGEVLILCILGLLPAPVFIISVTGTLKLLFQTPPAATSVPAEEKRRIVATLVLLLLGYTLMILPTLIMQFLEELVNTNLFETITTLYTLLLLSRFVDLFLYVFMLKELGNKLLVRLCCCTMEHTVADDGRGVTV